MKVHDISMTIKPKMKVYKNRESKQPMIITQATHDSDHYHESRINMDLHTGTHIDAPLHMIEDGETMEIYSIDTFVTSCKVLDLTFVEDGISREDLEAFEVEKDDFILLKTKNSFREKFHPAFIYLKASGARYLVEKKIKGVGIDALGIERSQDGHPTHKILLSSGIPIIEGLSLKAIESKRYELIALPLKIKSVEAAPVRAILIEK